MWSEFLVYLRLGFEHIADLRGYDHILFVVALTVMYPPRAWRRVVVLVTAFTVGHSITLALATLELIRIPTDLVELLIPVTIFVTAGLNLIEVGWPRGGEPGLYLGGKWWRGPTPGSVVDDESPAGGEPLAARRLKYGLALVFGLIHGMGFSNFLRAALGSEGSITLPLLAFNVGLEVGQVFIVTLVMAATALAATLPGLSRRRWVVSLSAVTAGLALYMVWQRLPI